MWQWLTNLWGDESRVLLVALAVAGVIVATLILLFVYRLVFGSRLRVPGTGRARQPRLGLVDAFWLDGQRQLVLVRRDNVEHLIMIGGPTDVVVESQIVRASVQTPAPVRDREAASPKLAPAAPAGAANPLPSPVSPPELPAKPPLIAVANSPPAAGPRAGPAVAVAPEPQIPAVESSPKAPEKPAERAAPEFKRPAAPPIRVEPVSPPPAGPPKVEAPSKPEAPPAKAEAAPSRPAPPPPRPAPLARPPLPPPITAGGSWPRAAPPGPKPPEPRTPDPQRVEAPPKVPPTPPPALASKPPPPAPPPPHKAEDPFADLESLEAEMARLLGRDP